jgi:hypothetical protein
MFNPLIILDCPTLIILVSLISETTSPVRNSLNTTNKTDKTNTKDKQKINVNPFFITLYKKIYIKTLL